MSVPFFSLCRQIAAGARKRKLETTWNQYPFALHASIQQPKGGLGLDLLVVAVYTAPLNLFLVLSNPFLELSNSSLMDSVVLFASISHE